MSAFRRTLVLALLLLFALGTPGYAMQPVDMAVQKITAAADDAMPADCDTCADDMAKSACASPCLVLAILPCANTYGASRAEALGRLPQQATSGAIAAPDPFPPKTLP